MYRLKLLGTPHLEGPSGPLQLGPRRVALLASLAAAGPGGLTRDKLVARLWPDSDDERAKRNLSQLLYAMRTELGADLVEGTGTLRIDPAQCGVDLLEFDLAIAERRDADAMERYAGPFLDGFHLADSPDFAQWSDGERDRRAAQVQSVATRLAEASATPAEAVSAWRRALALDPVAAPVALRLADALAKDGDRTAAIRVLEQYAARIRSEFESEPDRAILTRMDELRRTPVPSPDAVPTPSRISAETGADATRSSTPPQATVERTPAPPATAAPPSRTRWIVAAVLIATLGLIAWATRPAARLEDGEFVILAEFTNSTDDDLLTRTVGTAFGAALQQSAHVVPLPRGRISAALRRMEKPDTTERLDLDVAREVAQREGVRFILTGEIIAVGEQRQLITRIVASRTGRVVATRSAQVASDEDLLAAIDRLAATMRGDLGEASGTIAAAIPLPDVTTTSLAALHEYAASLDAQRRADDVLQEQHLVRAIALDSNFASAHAKLGEIYSLNNKVPESSFHFRRALAQLDRLSLDESLRIRISAAWSRGDRSETVALSKAYLNLRPRDAGAWSRLAFAYFSSGQQAEARHAYAVADSLVPLSAGSLLNIGTSWMSDGRRSGERADHDSARAYYERAFALQPALQYGTFYNHQYGTILIAIGLVDSARATFDRMTAREADDRARGLRSNALLDAYRGEWVSAFARLGEAADLGNGRRQWTTAIRNDALIADLALALGDRARAAAPLRRATTVSLREPLETRAIAFVALAQVKAGDRAAGTRLLARMREMSRVDNDAEQAVILAVQGAIALTAGQATDALEALRSAVSRDPLNVQLRPLLARAAEAAGNDEEALALWTELGRGQHWGAEGQFEWQFADFERARILERLGRTEQAEAALRALLARYPAADPQEPTLLRDARTRLARLQRRP